MNKFCVGDIVQARPDVRDENFYAEVHPGDIGTVVRADNDDSIGVDWGHWVDGHDCDTDIPYGNGTFVSSKYLQYPFSEEDEMDIPSPDLEGVL